MNYKLPLSNTDVKALIDEATAALDAGDEDKAIDIGRVLARDKVMRRTYPLRGEAEALFTRMHPMLLRRGVIKPPDPNFGTPNSEEENRIMRKAWIDFTEKRKK